MKEDPGNKSILTLQCECENSSRLLSALCTSITYNVDRSVYGSIFVPGSKCLLYTSQGAHAMQSLSYLVVHHVRDESEIR